MSDGEGDKSGSPEVDVLTGHDVGVPWRLAGGAAADSGGEGATSSAAAPTPQEHSATIGHPSTPPRVLRELFVMGVITITHLWSELPHAELLSNSLGTEGSQFHG